ncbi:hypothetical protein T310_7944 [Rasamsonia emersonii CBS 393.64]|uniref:Major facilitator superfamily (MFS) profile domain-containing protein n=1 Tax=Rasamsonia emersonii (strain ATCC 16479 / CBS 393.64 / IMI 116815) TaxID=1408163 RepID=A0A0F4YKH4_RASE3|nr:hypothetical protein T310_7944 [Rasamsonia emersonii CBS 393.64]KKA18108.1 hypothetical protein T310_7944 [Rasamsonia emersonii CBS 393.64]
MRSKAVYLYGIAPCTGGLAFGYVGLLSPFMRGILAMPQFLSYFDYPSNFRQGGITASILAGAFAGSIITGAFLADRLGRKRTILLGSAIFTIGCAISAAANGLAALVAGRLINGLGNGCLAMMVPLYQGELSPRESATVALHITMYFLPESPRWLIQKDRQEEALQVLARVHAQGDVNDPYVLAEFQEITAKIAYEKLHPPPSYWKLLFGEERRRMWIGIGVQFWQSMTGINIIMYYAVFLFQQAGLSETSSSLLANGLQGLVLNVFTLPDMYYMDKWGRRIPMIIGGIGMGISMMLIGVIMKTEGDPVFDSLTQKTNFTFKSAAASRTVIAFVYIYVMVFALTWACVAWVYPPEIFSMNMRGRATSMTTATNWFINFWFGLYIPTAMNKISWKLYIIFMALCYLMSIVVYLFYPESAGKTLEEMDLLFTKGRSPWVFLDRDATKIGAIFERDLARGEALIVDKEKGDVDVAVARQVEDIGTANANANANVKEQSEKEDGNV